MSIDEFKRWADGIVIPKRMRNRLEAQEAAVRQAITVCVYAGIDQNEIALLRKMNAERELHVRRLAEMIRVLNRVKNCVEERALPEVNPDTISLFSRALKVCTPARLIHEQSEAEFFGALLKKANAHREFS